PVLFRASIWFDRDGCSTIAFRFRPRSSACAISATQLRASIWFDRDGYSTIAFGFRPRSSACAISAIQLRADRLDRAVCEWPARSQLRSLYSMELASRLAGALRVVWRLGAGSGLAGVRWGF